MLDPAIQNQLKEYFGNLKHTVSFRMALDSSDKSAELKTLVEDVVALSDRLDVHSQELISNRAPSVELYSGGEPTGIAFAGIPMGHEFNSFIIAILNAGGHPLKITPEQEETIRGISTPHEFVTYISLSCQNCPEVVQALNVLSVLNPNIKHTMVDGALFQEEVDAVGVQAVPYVTLNGDEFSQGRRTLEEFLERLDDSVAEKQVDKINSKEKFDVLIVGGGPAGASAAIYSARKGLRTGIVADRFGGQVQETVGIENFISVNKTEGPRLVANLENHVQDYDVDIILNQRAAGIKKDTDFTIDLESGAALKAKSIILATGARWREINVPGEKEYKGNGVAYCPHCDGPFFKGKDVAVIGGGNSGVEAAIDLAGIVNKVTLLEFADGLKADAVLQDKLRSLANVDIITNAMTKEIAGDGEKVSGLVYQDRTTEEVKKVPLSGVFIQIGLSPNSEWLPETVEKTKFGEVVTDAKGQTSLEGVFAAGDVTDVPYKQIIIAMGEGAKASLGSFDYLVRNT